MDVRSFTVGPVPRTATSPAPTARRRRSWSIPGEEADRLLAAIDELGLDVEAILLTHTHFDHVGAVAPVARATGAPVYCPQLEVPVLADIMSFVPWPGFGPFESYDADETVAGGEHLELAGLDIDVLFTPGHSPGHVTYSIPAERALFSGDVLFQGSIGRTDLPGGDSPTLLRSIATLVDGFPPETTVYPGTWASPRSAASRPRTRSCWKSPRSGEPGEAPGAARHVRRAARAGGRARGRRARGAPDPRARGLRADRDADVRGDRAVRARRGGEHRHRAEGDVHVRRRRRALADAAAGGHGAGLPRLRRARHAQAAPAGAACGTCRASSATRRRRPAATASSGRSGSRRSAPTTRPSTPRRSCCSPSCSTRSARATCACGSRRLGSPEVRAAYRDRAAGLPARARGGAVRRGARAHRPQPAARVRRRPPGHAGGDGRRAAAARPPRAARTPSTSRRCARCSTGRAWPTRSIPRSCAASTTTRARCSSSRAPRSAPSPGSAAAAATTGSWRRSAARRRRGAAGRPASSGSCSPPTTRPARCPARRRPRLRSTCSSPSPDAAQRADAFGLTVEARRAGLGAQMELAGRSLKGQLKQADRVGARFVAILSAEGAALKDMESGEQRDVEPGGGACARSCAAGGPREAAARQRLPGRLVRRRRRRRARATRFAWPGGSTAAATTAG